MANFRCPLCGDSSKDQYKKRAWFERWNGELSFKCWNCGKRKPFWLFVKEDFPGYYDDYIREVLENGGYNVDRFKNTVKVSPSASTSIFQTQIDKLDLQSLEELPSNHRAVNYCRDRLIPERFWNDIYYTDNFHAWANEKDPEKFQKIVEEDKRILFPLRSRKDKSIFAVAARTITNKTPKYYNFKLADGVDMIFGLDRININQRIRMVEGAVDSLFLRNCVAATGTAFDKLKKYDRVLIFDNEPRNSQVMRIMERFVKEGNNVVIWPENWPYKDINEAVMDGCPVELIEEVIDKNTFSGIQAEVKFKLWRKM